MTRPRTATFLLALGALAAAPALALPQSAPGPEKLTEHTFRLASGATSPAATVADMAWLAGHWRGDALGGVSEEIWSPPEAGTMMGMYRLVRDGKTAFYELLTIVEEDGSLLLRLKHFDPDLTAWEEKAESVEFPLVAVADGAVHFEGLSFHPQGRDAVTIYLALDREEGGDREATFAYRRVKPGG